MFTKSSIFPFSFRWYHLTCQVCIYYVTNSRTYFHAIGETKHEDDTSTVISCLLHFYDGDAPSRNLSWIMETGWKEEEIVIFNNVDLLTVTVYLSQLRKSTPLWMTFHVDLLLHNWFWRVRADASWLTSLQNSFTCCRWEISINFHLLHGQLDNYCNNYVTHRKNNNNSTPLQMTIRCGAVTHIWDTN